MSSHHRQSHKRPSSAPLDDTRLVKHVRRHERPSSPPSSRGIRGENQDRCRSVLAPGRQHAASSTTTKTSTAQCDLAAASDKLAQPAIQRGPGLRPFRAASSLSTDHATQRKQLPSINTSVNPSIHLLPSSQTHTSPPALDSSFSPPLVPPIRRETLRELDLEAILDNVQLRHDLLFDPGLQFRPLTSRRRRIAADRYWMAILHELESGCICTSFDEAGHLLPCKHAACDQVGLAWVRPGINELKTEALKDMTVNPSPSPLSRVPPLITELREVMLSVMVPSSLPPPPRTACSLLAGAETSADVTRMFATHAVRVSQRMVTMTLASDCTTHPDVPRSPTEVATPTNSSTSSTLVSPDSSKASLTCLVKKPRSTRVPVLQPPLSAQTLCQHDQIRATLDVPHVTQQIAHGAFDPSEVFLLLGNLIKYHCAPMRDAAVEDVVATASAACIGADSNCETPRNVRLSNVVLAIRKFFDLLELMKLDIANHQLQFLREYLFRTSADCELDALYNHQLRGMVTLESTRRWITQHVTKSFPHRSPSEPRSITINHALCEGVVDLIFYPPHNTLATHASLAEQVFLPPSSPDGSHNRQYPLHHHQQPQHAPATPVPGYPESFWLDHTRLSVLSTDVADITAVYMILVLFRQTVYSLSDSKIQVQDADLIRLKREIWQVGPQRPGWCFFRGGFGAIPIADYVDGKNKEEEESWRRGMKDIVLRLAARTQETLAGVSIGSACDSECSAKLSRQHLPDSEHVQLLERWMFSNMTESPIMYNMLRKKLRGVLQDLVHNAILPTSSAFPATASSSPWVNSTLAPSIPSGTGLQPLFPEIRLLGDQIAKLVSLHSSVYWHIYNAPGFILEPC